MFARRTAAQRASDTGKTELVADRLCSQCSCCGQNMTATVSVTLKYICTHSRPICSGKLSYNEVTSVVNEVPTGPMQRGLDVRQAPAISNALGQLRNKAKQADGSKLRMLTLGSHG